MTVTTPPSARLDVIALRAALAAEPDTLLVDVRSPGEFRAASIDGAVNIPLDRLDAHLRRIVHDAGGRMVLVCQSGARAARAAEKLGRAGVADVAALEGGMNAWRRARLPVREGRKRLPVDRQVQLIAGLMVLTGVTLGAFVNSWFLVIAAFFGAGLTFAGATGTCGLALLLMKMPWNRLSVLPADGGSAVCAAGRQSAACSAPMTRPK